MHRNELDEIDNKLLNLLQRNCSIGHKGLAAALNLSLTPVHIRIKRLEKEGYIRKYVALVDPIKIGKGLIAFTQVLLSTHDLNSINNFKDMIVGFEQVQECHHVSGTFDFLLRVAVSNMDEYNGFFNKLSAINLVKSIQSTFVLSDVKYDTGYYLPEKKFPGTRNKKFIITTEGPF